MVLVHAGAGSFSAELFDDERGTTDALLEALAAAQGILESRGGDAMEAAIAAVMSLEGCELFNAGIGSALCADGTVQMSAGLMRGHDRAAGAVAGVTRTEHPIRAARAVLDAHQVLVIGDAADRLAEAHGESQRPPQWFITDRQRARLEAKQRHVSRGTVGAVCLDAAGRLAAATSTGGITGQPPGRVGDTPVIGAGTWADAGVAVSCTGQGEAFIRVGVARQIALAVAHGTPLDAASRQALTDVQRLGGDGGLIALTATGDTVLPFVTEAMPRGRWRAGAPPEVWAAG